MSSAENTQLMRRWFHEVWNEGKIQTVHELFAADGVARGQAGPEAVIRGPAEFVPFVEQIRSAFPDIDIKVEDAFGTGDMVAVRWSAAMTHQGDHLGIAASGKRVQITGITIVRIVNGKIVEGWDNWDQLGMWQQVGALPPVAAVQLAKTA